ALAFRKSTPASPARSITAPRRRPASSRMAIPVLVNQVFRRLLAECTEPLRAVGRHPDEIAGLDGIPLRSKKVDAAAFEHQQAMLHHVDFDGGQRRSGLIRHRVHAEVERAIVRQEPAYLEPRIAAEERGGRAALA